MVPRATRILRTGVVVITVPGVLATARDHGVVAGVVIATVYSTHVAVVAVSDAGATVGDRVVHAVSYVADIFSTRVAVITIRVRYATVSRWGRDTLPRHTAVGGATVSIFALAVFRTTSFDRIKDALITRTAGVLSTGFVIIAVPGVLAAAGDHCVATAVVDASIGRTDVAVTAFRVGEATFLVQCNDTTAVHTLTGCAWICCGAITVVTAAPVHWIKETGPVGTDVVGAGITVVAVRW